IAISNDYPMAPPSVRMMTKAYHPNIDPAGRICNSALSLDMKNTDWTAAYNLHHVLIVVANLLTNP
ncbi:UBC-like protein, partial [Lojkania enalia]